MIYVVDTNIFSRAFNNVPLEVFDDIWKPWSTLMQEEKIVSVDEVYCELAAKWGDTSDEGKWLKAHHDYFLKPSNDEGFIVANIFKNKRFQEGVKEASLRNGTPEADVLLVAKAKAMGGVVVTAEKDDKPNSEKIPNMAIAFGVPYMRITDYYKMLRNVHNKRPESEGVQIYRSLGVPSDY